MTMFQKLFRTDKHGIYREVTEVPGDYTDTMGTSQLPRFPHCDMLILHSPGTCEYCDRHQDWQRLRAAQGIAFSDYDQNTVKKNDLIPCPSTFRRLAEVRDRWYGNVPKDPDDA